MQTRCFTEKDFDNQISKVFLLWLDVDEADITVQKEEIDSVVV